MASDEFVNSVPFLFKNLILHTPGTGSAKEIETKKSETTNNNEAEEIFFLITEIDVNQMNGSLGLTQESELDEKWLS